MMKLRIWNELSVEKNFKNILCNYSLKLIVQVDSASC